MPAAVAQPELTDTRAVAGRTVQITVPVGYPEDVLEHVLASAVARARQHLQAVAPGGRGELDTFYDRSGADLVLSGSLARSYTSVWQLRAAAYAAVAAGAAEHGVTFEGFGPEDVGVLDLDAESYDVGFDPSYYDPTGDVNPDGSLNWGNIIEGGTEEGLDNFGAGIGRVATAIGGATGSLTGGFFSGLGLWGSVVFLAVLALVAFLALGYVFGGPGLGV